MNFLEYFYKKNIKQDFINKFLYKNTKNIPKIKKIILNINCKTNEIKYLASNLIALQFITNQKSCLTLAKKSNIILKIRQGNPIGCKVTLRKHNMLNCFSKVLIEIFPKLKNFYNLKINKKIKLNAYSYTLKDIFNFTILEEYYYLFNNLTKLNIIIITNTKTKKELFFFLKLLQLPIIET